MSKRKPTSELNDRNWDEEEEQEEAGTFRLADQDVLKHRTIRKARRTVHNETSSSGGLFSGFALKTSDSSVPKPSLSSGMTVNFGSNLHLQSQKSNGATQKTTTADSNNCSSSTAENPEYLRQLKVLNENILSWIGKHVGDNPYCILTPSFKDYEKHLTALECKYNVVKASEPASVVKSAETKEAKPAEASLFASGLGTKAAATTGFTFGQSASSASTTAADTPADKGSTSGFSFGSGLTKTTGGFGGFSSPTPFSFGAAAAQQKPPEKTGEGGDDEYEPPKAEVREIKEDGAVYTKRCKLFHQKDGQWADRGVGNLHLKSTDDGRTQLIVRADTNLGNILLNILLSSGIPTKRQGKNNVFLVCVPNPPIDPKKPSSEPTPMMIRVKNAEDADELLAKLEELKASN